MKRLILIILFIPNLTTAQMLYGNSTITYKDIMSIDSKDTYISLMVDNGYIYQKDEKETFTIHYALNPTKENGREMTTSSSWFMEYLSYNIIYIDFRKLAGGRVYENTYDNIREKVEKKCKYVKSINSSNNIYKAYSCKKAKFEGLIGFALNEFGFGMIKTFPLK